MAVGFSLYVTFNINNIDNRGAISVNGDNNIVWNNNTVNPAPKPRTITQEQKTLIANTLELYSKTPITVSISSDASFDSSSFADDLAKAIKQAGWKSYCEGMLIMATNPKGIMLGVNTRNQIIGGVLQKALNAAGINAVGRPLHDSIPDNQIEIWVFGQE